MKYMAIQRMAVAAAIVLTITCVAAHAEPEVTQTFQLHPGWNAIFLEVQPEPRGPASIFDGLPVESVWTWLDNESRVEFIQNPGEDLWGQPGWHAYFSAPKQAFLTNLFAVLGNQAYLIKLSGNEDVNWEIKGCPSTRKINWTSDSFNLVGFHLNPDTPPTFEAFFASSSAHAGQAMYRLNRQGIWEFVEDPANATLCSGEAYWVFCEGGSNYQGSLQVELPMFDGLNYGAILNEQTVTIRNLSEVTRIVTLTLSSSAVVLAYRNYDQSSGYFTWPPLEDMPPVSLGPGKQANVRIAVRREVMKTGVAESVLKISDDSGIQVLVPVSAERIGQ